MIKNKKLAIAISAFGLIFLIVTGYSIWSRNYKYYDTPEQAVYAYEERGSGVQYLSFLEDKGGLGIAFYKKQASFMSQGDFLSIKIEKKDKKWRVLRNESIENAWKMKIVNNYMLSWGECRDKFYISITYNGDLNSNNQPQDSLNSTFLFYQYPLSIIPTYDWFLVLDEEPQNYYVILNGEKVQLTE